MHNSGCSGRLEGLRSCLTASSEQCDRQSECIQLEAPNETDGRISDVIPEPWPVRVPHRDCICFPCVLYQRQAGTLIRGLQYATVCSSRVDIILPAAFAAIAQIVSASDIHEAETIQNASAGVKDRY